MGKTTLGEVELLVLLAILRLGDEAYGVTICREIERRTGRELRRATAYVTLQRLEAQELVTSWLGDPSAERGGKAKRHYRVSAAGVELVQRAREGYESMWTGVESLETVK